MLILVSLYPQGPEKPSEILKWNVGDQGTERLSSGASEESATWFFTNTL